MKFIYQRYDIGNIDDAVIVHIGSFLVKVDWGLTHQVGCHCRHVVNIHLAVVVGVALLCHNVFGIDQADGSSTCSYIQVKVGSKF